MGNRNGQSKESGNIWYTRRRQTEQKHNVMIDLQLRISALASLYFNSVINIDVYCTGDKSQGLTHKVPGKVCHLSGHCQVIIQSVPRFLLFKEPLM